MSAVLITGATGKQGGAVIKTLLSKRAGFEILAVTRNARSPAAQKLSHMSSTIKLVEGNLDDPAGIFRTARSVTSAPIWGVFSVQSIMGKGQDVKAEERQGKALIDESIKQGVKFYVYTSVDRGGDASIDNPTDIPHFISKHRIEQHLMEKTKHGEMDWTILRPTAFFENLVPGFLGKAFATSWKVSLKNSKPLQLIAVSDIGYFGAQAFLEPEKFKGKCYSLAGDELTYDQLAKIFKDKTGKDLPTASETLCSLFMWLVKEFGYMFRWFRDHGYNANIQEIRKIHPGLKDFAAWLEKDSQFMKR